MNLAMIQGPHQFLIGIGTGEINCSPEVRENIYLVAIPPLINFGCLLMEPDLKRMIGLTD